MLRQQRILFKSAEKTEDKGKNYVYNERSYRSFSRRIPIPEEIVPSKVTAKSDSVNDLIQLSNLEVYPCA